MSFSPLQMAAMQPCAFWQAIFGSAAGIVLGFRGGQAIARVRSRPLSASQTPTIAWTNALLQLLPWVAASFLSHEGYESLMITSSWATTWVRRLLPLMRSCDLGFLFGFAVGYFWGSNPQLNG